VKYDNENKTILLIRIDYMMTWIVDIQIYSQHDEVKIYENWQKEYENNNYLNKIPNGLESLIQAQSI